MKCPKCGTFENRVLDTRVHQEGEVIRRRRECGECKYRFTTEENLLRTFPAVVKKSGRKDNFSKLKLLTGLQAACMKRPISLDKMEQIVDLVSSNILEMNRKEISSDEIGLIVMEQLRNVDDVAFVRFASVYRNFEHIKEFIDSLKGEEPEVQEALSKSPSKNTKINNTEIDH
ncbi:MAG: transcriptional regulator NrdR [Bdellovibrionales bacterium]